MVYLFPYCGGIARNNISLHPSISATSCAKQMTGGMPYMFFVEDFLY
jgi:hypothetical protein